MRGVLVTFRDHGYFKSARYTYSATAILAAKSPQLRLLYFFDLKHCMFGIEATLLATS